MNTYINWKPLTKDTIFHTTEGKYVDKSLIQELIFYIKDCGYFIRKTSNHWLVPEIQYNTIIDIIKWKFKYDIAWENRKKRKSRKLLLFGI